MSASPSPLLTYKNLLDQTVFQLDAEGNLFLAGTLNQVGTKFFVDQTTGSDTEGNGTPLAPFATIQAALDVASDGDSIEVLPGSYEENLVITQDYLTLAGAFLGGYARPDIVPTTGVPLTVTGQGFVAVHVRFAGTAADPVVQKGNGFLYSDCVFDGDGTASKGYRLIPSNTDDSLTASEGKILSCLFRGNAVALIFDTALPAVGVGSTDNLIQGCRFEQNTLDIATADTGGASTYSVKTVLVKDCTFEDKNKATYIDLTTANGGAADAQTGTFMQNFLATDTITTTKIKAVGTGFTFVGNADTVGIFDGSGLD